MQRPYRTGEVLINRFEIHSLFKSTELSHIYLALDRTTQKKIVIKCTSCEKNEKSKIKLERSKIEANILQMLNHPSIVRFVYSWDNKKDYNLVTDYVNAKSLKEIFKNGSPTYEAITEYLLQLLEVTEYLHHKGVVHRDIKPSNLLFGDNIVLLDFGAAETTSLNKPHHKVIIGTPGYQCPESFRGIISAQSDIYSIGATLLFLLTGQAPTGDLSRFRMLSPHKDLLELAFKAMDPIPEKRFETVFEMKQKLLSIAMPQSKLISGNNIYPILKNRVTIGRSNDSDFKILDPSKLISPLHAEINMVGKQFFITDRSINGTFIYRDENYKKISQCALSNGDIIALCYKPSKGPYRLLKFRQNVA